MRVEQIMTKDVKTCRPEDMLNLAAQMMWENDCGALPVIDNRSKVVGMITDRDICMAAYTQGSPLSAIAVDSAMAKEVYSCNVGDSLQTAEKIMQTHQIRRLPVLGFEGELVGILSLNDLARAAEREGGRRPHEVKADEIGLTLAAIGHSRRAPAQPVATA